MTIRPLSRTLALTAMLAILLLASVFYLRDINRISFWEDESWMAIAIRGDLPGVWTFAAERGLHPPLYFYIGWFFTRLTGNSELALRWLAGLCLLPGLALTYRLGADWFGRRAGIYAAALAAGSIFLIYFGRLARQYTLFFTLAVALVWAYERWWKHSHRSPNVVVGEGLRPSPMETRPSPVFWLVTIALCQAGLLYTHYFGAWMGLTLGLHGLFFLRTWRDRFRLCVALALGGGLFLFWIPALLTQFQRSGDLDYGIRDIGNALHAYTDRLFNGDYSLGYVLLLLGVVAVLRWRVLSGKRWRVAGLLAIWLLVPAALILLYNERFVWFVERNLIFTLGGVYILFGAGLAWIAEFGRWRWLSTLALLAFIMAGILRYDLFWPVTTPPWRSLARAIAEDSRPGDTFVIGGEPFSLDYYLEKFMGEPPLSIIGTGEWTRHSDNPSRIWLTATLGAVSERALNALPPDVQQTRRYALGVLVTEFYQRPPQDIVTTFGDQIALGVAELPAEIRAKPGETITLELWWQSRRQPDFDYSVGVYLLNTADGVIAQQDGGFDRGRVSALALPHDRWQVDERAIMIPANTSPGHYTLTVAVYDWRDGSRLAPDNGRTDQGYELATVVVE
jgi:4-amino-4-deoxy-L-arabinose transferase-like glycosyltransferase